MSESPGIEKARSLAKAAENLYPELKRECEEKVVRWERGDFVLHSLEPAYFEIHKHRPGNRLEGEAATRRGWYAHGFDAQGRLVLLREYVFSDRFYETFYRWEVGGTSLLRYGYDPKKEWIYAAWFSRDGEGRVRSIDTVHPGGAGWSKIYQYDPEGRVIKVEERHGGESRDFRDIEYDPEGKIARVYRREPGGERILDFERPSRERTFPVARDELSRTLADAIVASLARLSLQEPVYALALWYCDAEYQFRLPPHVAIGLDSERKRFAELRDKDVLWFIWNPAEWKMNHVHAHLDEELSSRCDSVNQDIWQNDRQKEVDVFLADLAQRLAKAGLPFPRTDDFVAYAINLDNGEHAEAVASQIAPESAMLLRQRGLL